MTTGPIRVAVTGIGGRMGSLIARMVRESKELTLAAGTEKPGTSAAGVALAASLAQTDVVIDFTTPEATLEHAAACAAAHVPLVVGTTGLSAAQRAELAAAARETPIVFAPNMSVGVNLVIELAAQLARRLGEDFDVEILETHHRHKKDAPSGTAMRLAEEVARSLGRGEEDVRTSRVGQVGERPRREIGVQALRGGDVVGEHTVFFFGDGERVELTHRATSREQFGRGALRAARWIVGQPPGLYGMADVLRG